MSSSLPSRAVTSLRLRALDLRDRARGSGDPLVPPRRLQFIGVGDFVEVGDEFAGHFRTLAAMTPSSRVLDVGSGIGRIARPLASFLDERGSYDGFDPDPDGVAWCVEAYSGRSNFRFAHVDAYNARYNPAGTVKPETLRFPYADASFDLVVMVSVLTHLLPATLDNYLRETRRVLAPGGRLCTTAFLLQDDSRAALAGGRAFPTFQPERDGHAVADTDIPEDAVAYDSDGFVARLAAAGLVDPRLHLGSWADRSGSVTYQDLVVARAG